MTNADERSAVLRKDEFCSHIQTITRGISLLDGKWTVYILCAMLDGPVRLGQLLRLVPLASKKVLTKTLRDLERSGLVSRTDLSTSILHVEYRLSDLRETDTRLVLSQLQVWAEHCERVKNV